MKFCLTKMFKYVFHEDLIIRVLVCSSSAVVTDRQCQSKESRRAELHVYLHCSPASCRWVFLEENQQVHAQVRAEGGGAATQFNFTICLFKSVSKDFCLKQIVCQSSVCLIISL